MNDIVFSHFDEKIRVISVSDDNSVNFYCIDLENNEAKLLNKNVYE